MTNTCFTPISYVIHGSSTRESRSSSWSKALHFQGRVWSCHPVRGVAEQFQHYCLIVYLEPPNNWSAQNRKSAKSPTQHWNLNLLHYSTTAYRKDGPQQAIWDQLGDSIVAIVSGLHLFRSLQYWYHRVFFTNNEEMYIRTLTFAAFWKVSLQASMQKNFGNCQASVRSLDFRSVRMPTGETRGL